MMNKIMENIKKERYSYRASSFRFCDDKVENRVEYPSAEVTDGEEKQNERPGTFDEKMEPIPASILSRFFQKFPRF